MISEVQRRLLEIDESNLRKYQVADKCKSYRANHLAVCTVSSTVKYCAQLLTVPRRQRAKDSTRDAKALHMACSRGDATEVELLLQCGVDSRVKSPGGLPPLYFAVSSGCKNVIKLLINWGNDVDEEVPILKLGRHLTLLQYAILTKHIKVVKALIHCGANIHASNVKGLTALQYAIKNGKLHVFRLLLKHGADVHHRDIHGRNALHHVFGPNYNFAILHDLLKLKSDVNALTSNKMSPLHYAVTYLRRDSDKPGRACALLLDYGARLEARCGQGRTALHIATERRNLKLVQLLVDFGADVNAQDAKGRSVLEYALDRGLKEITEHLLLNGAQCARIINWLFKPLTRDLAAIFIKYWIAKRTAGLPIDSQLLATLSKATDFNNFEVKCAKEVDIMRWTKLIGNISALECLRASRRQLVAIRSRHTVKDIFIAIMIIVRLPIYKKIIKINFQEVQKFAPVLNEATACLNVALEQRMLILILDKIISFMGYAEVKNLIVAVKKSSDGDN